jgi:hypothetical protein
MQNTVLKFNSAICTSIEQSQRLLAFGLKPETADMYIFDDEVYIGKPNVDDIPAWSMHRLLCMLYTREDVYPIMPSTAYDDIIDEIENEIKCGGFNKEYLKR